MKVPWWPVVGILLGVGVLVAFDRWSTREDRWREKLAVAVTKAKQADSLAHVRDSLRHIKDSVEQAALIAKADSAETERIRLGRENGRLRVLLAQAPTLPDTVAIQARIIAVQDSTIQSDSGQKATLRQTIVKQGETIVDLTNSLAESRKRLADLIGVAERPPKEFTFLGLKLSLKPYVGVGVNLSQQGKASTGLQLGVSILRG